MSTTIERRIVSSSLEVRDGEGGATPVIRGYAAVFGVLSVDLGGFREFIRPGAFGKSLRRKDDIRALVDHDPSKIIGRSIAGTLRLKEDEKGLAVEIDPADTSAGRDIMVSIRRGDVTQMSFGFVTREDAWMQGDGGVVRELVEADLFDVSPVTFPAYLDTSVAVRSLGAWQQRRSRLDLAERRIKIENLRATT